MLNMLKARMPVTRLVRAIEIIILVNALIGLYQILTVDLAHLLVLEFEQMPDYGTKQENKNADQRK